MQDNASAVANAACMPRMYGFTTEAVTANERLTYLGIGWSGGHGVLFALCAFFGLPEPSFSGRTIDLISLGFSGNDGLPAVAGLLRDSHGALDCFGDS